MTERYDVVSRRNLAVFGVIGVACIVLAVVVSRTGPAYASDTAVYFGMARNLLDGHGPTSPITLAFTDYFSPAATARLNGVIPVTTLPLGYPVLLAAIGIFGVSLDTAARILGAVGLGFSAVVLAAMTLRLTRGSWAAAASTLALFLVAGPMFFGFYPVSWLLLSSYALAEVVFLAITLFAVLAMASLLRRGRTVDVWTTGLLIGAAITMRYLGVAFVLAVLVLVALRREWDVATRFRRGAALVALAVAPLGLWLVGLRLQYPLGEPSTPLRLRSIDGSLFTGGAETIAHWFVPDTVMGGWAVFVTIVFLGATAAVIVIAMRRGFHDDPLLTVMLTVGAAYVLTLFAAILLTNSNIGFDGRLLAPVRALAYVVVVAAVFQVVIVVARSLSSSATASRAVAGGVVVVLALLVCLPSTRSTARLVRRGGPVGLTALTGLVAAADALPPGAFIMSNAPETLWLGTGKRSIIVPIRRVPEAGVDNPHFERDLGETARLLTRRDGYLVMFDGYDGSELATTEQIAERVHLEQVQRVADGAIYHATPGTP